MKLNIRAHFNIMYVEVSYILELVLLSRIYELGRNNLRFKVIYHAIDICADA